ncbi:MAG: hypothetical protein ABWW66_03700 [Archaeoglobaceae archaeon]
MLKYCENGTIPAAELDSELSLTLEYFRLALPKSSLQDSLSWHSRIFSSDFEIPYVVRFFFRGLKSGKASWRKAIEDYFRTIGEEKPEEFVEIFEQIVRRSKNLVVCGEDIVDVAMRFRRDGGVVIAELKGAGLISPSVGCGRFGRARAPLYEVNRFFAYEVRRYGEGTRERKG